MPKRATTVRLDPALYQQSVREAGKAGLTFSGVVHLLLRAFTEGTVAIGVTRHPPGYLETLANEADTLRRSHRRGKAKRYASSQALFDDLLGR